MDHNFYSLYFVSIIQLCPEYSRRHIQPPKLLQFLFILCIFHVNGFQKNLWRCSHFTLCGLNCTSRLFGPIILNQLVCCFNKKNKFKNVVVGMCFCHLTRIFKYLSCSTYFQTASTHYWLVVFHSNLHTLRDLNPISVIISWHSLFDLR